MQNQSRAGIMRWLSEIGAPIEKVEDVGKGAVLCRILKKMDPSFPRFKEAPATEAEYIGNLKLVQQHFEQKGIRFHFPVEKMAKLRLQDNLEAIQWLQRYWLRGTGGNIRAQEAMPNDVLLLKQEIEGMREALAQKQGQIERLRESAKIFQDERDFYFNKLVMVEKLLKDEGFHLNNDSKKDLLMLMYES